MNQNKTYSKKMALWLRHDPAAGGLSLDAQGWAMTDKVLEALTRKGLRGGREALEQIVAQCEKSRFELSPDGVRIRARQGHSVDVDLDWPAAEPPEFLYHGTVERFLASILAEGLKPGARHHVHLSPDVVTARTVGARRGRPVVLKVLAGAMAGEGHVFRLSSNGVWLTDCVPPPFLQRLDAPAAD